MQREIERKNTKIEYKKKIRELDFYSNNNKYL